MSYTREVTLWCDAEGCSEWFQQGDRIDRVRELRATARSCGWRAGRDNTDLCPDHAQPRPQRATVEAIWPGSCSPDGALGRGAFAAHRLDREAGRCAVCSLPWEPLDDEAEEV